MCLPAYLGDRIGVSGPRGKCIGSGAGSVQTVPQEAVRFVYWSAVWDSVPFPLALAAALVRLLGYC